MTLQMDDLLGLRSVVRSNLQYQHYWSDIKLLDSLVDLDDSAPAEPLSRPLLCGRPPEQLYSSDPAPESEASPAEKPPGEMEYVLPVHLTEKLSLRTWAAIFDVLPTPVGENGKKRIVVAVVSGDSTVVYYIMHDGIVKPRQN